MKWILLVLCCITTHFLLSQTLQLHYDLRHTIDPRRSSHNFSVMYFEYFKSKDSGKSFIIPGSFLLKAQANFWGSQHNMGEAYLQVSQTFCCWRPKLFINVQYSGGLGVTEPKQYSYYINNTYAIGISYPFKWGNSYISSVLNYKYVPYTKRSHDFLYTLYWWKGLWNYKAELSGDFSIWTENKNHGDDATKNLSGKRFYFFAEPQFWYKIKGGLTMGTKLNIYYHALIADNVLQAYPTIGIRCKL